MFQNNIHQNCSGCLAIKLLHHVHNDATSGKHWNEGSYCHVLFVFGVFFNICWILSLLIAITLPENPDKGHFQNTSLDSLDILNTDGSCSDFFSDFRTFLYVIEV